jgi:hypothetical protein
MLKSIVPREVRQSIGPERIAAVMAFGFTERQARFLAHVLVFSGVFLERQYRVFTGLVHGQKTHDFLTKLITDGYATAVTPGALHRGRLYHVHYKPLYEAIGEPNNRHRKPASLGRFVERLMLLDAVLADDRCGWLGTERDKRAYFAAAMEMKIDFWLPHLTFGRGADTTTRWFPDKLPIGVPRDYGRRHVFLFLATRPIPMEFRLFLLSHANLLSVIRDWTIRVLFPRRLRRAAPLYRYAVRDAFLTPLTSRQFNELEWYFRHRRGEHLYPAREWDLDAATMARTYHAARFEALYRAWLRRREEALRAVQNPSLGEAMRRGWARVEFVQLPHQYLQLTPLIGGGSGTARRPPHGARIESERTETDETTADLYRPW